jgi:hypothetical protein
MNGVSGHLSCFRPITLSTGSRTFFRYEENGGFRPPFFILFTSPMFIIRFSSRLPGVDWFILPRMHKNGRAERGKTDRVNENEVAWTGAGQTNSGHSMKRTGASYSRMP